MTFTLASLSRLHSKVVCWFRLFGGLERGIRSPFCWLCSVLLFPYMSFLWPSGFTYLGIGMWFRSLTDHVKTRDTGKLFQALISRLEDGSQLDRVSAEVGTLLTDTMSSDSVSRIRLSWVRNYRVANYYIDSYLELAALLLPSSGALYMCWKDGLTLRAPEIILGANRSHSYQ